jgi:uncharacterized protein YfiM (DUF2279 family)
VGPARTFKFIYTAGNWVSSATIMLVATGALYATQRNITESNNMNTGLVFIAVAYIARVASSEALGVRETAFSFSFFDLTIGKAATYITN